MIELGLADGSLIDELVELTAQSLTQLEINEHFNVVKEIGRGKYGKVLLVTHRCRGTPMALKVMPKASTRLLAFLREYCISLHLSRHPCIVGLFGIAFQSQDHYGFAQELVIGRDLFAVIQPKVGIPEASVKRCVLQISSALEFIHACGLVHRDIKPENILLLDQLCCRVKLADFGLAQKTGTLIRSITGTLPYMSPELCALAPGEGDGQAQPLSVEPSLDTWALGVVLFCILTGYFPWERCSPGDDFYQEYADWWRTRAASRPTEKQEEEERGEGRQEEEKHEEEEGEEEVPPLWRRTRAALRPTEKQEEEERGEGRQEEGGEEVPPLWRRFTPVAMEMFGRLMALEAGQRCDVQEVRLYVEKDWIKEAFVNGQTESEGGGANVQSG